MYALSEPDVSWLTVDASDRPTVQARRCKLASTIFHSTKAGSFSTCFVSEPPNGGSTTRFYFRVRTTPSYLFHFPLVSRPVLQTLNSVLPLLERRNPGRPSSSRLPASHSSALLAFGPLFQISPLYFCHRRWTVFRLPDLFVHIAMPPQDTGALWPVKAGRNVCTPG